MTTSPKVRYLVRVVALAYIGLLLVVPVSLICRIRWVRAFSSHSSSFQCFDS